MPTLDKLFTVDKRKPVYATLDAELAAIQRRTKSISFFASDRAAVEADLGPIVKAAMKRGLAVTTAPRGDSVDILVHRVGEAHRIEPLQAILSSSPWTFALEEELGTQLGYSPKERAAWMAAERYARPAYGVLTIYARVGKGFDPKSNVVWFTQPGKVAAKNAKKKLGRVELWRIGMAPEYAKKVKKDGYVVAATLVQRQVREQFKRTPHQKLTPSGWRDAK